MMSCTKLEPVDGTVSTRARANNDNGPVSTRAEVNNDNGRRRRSEESCIRWTIIEVINLVIVGAIFRCSYSPATNNFWRLAKEEAVYNGDRSETAARLKFCSSFNRPDILARLTEQQIAMLRSNIGGTSLSFDGIDEDEQSNPSEFVRLNFMTMDNNVVVYRSRRTTQMGRLMRRYCDRSDVQMSSLRFLYDGRRILEHQTPLELELENGDVIDVVSEQEGGYGSRQK